MCRATYSSLGCAQSSIHYASSKKAMMMLKERAAMPAPMSPSPKLMPTNVE
jgi:hypothetical protein